MKTHCPTQPLFSHDFGQNQKRPQETRVFWVTGVTLGAMFLEIFTGIWSGSMALLADGVHMGTHALALGLALLAYRFSRSHALDRRFSFGTGKVGELAGFSSALLLAFSAIFLVVESVERLLNPLSIAYAETLVVAGIGLLVNLVSAFLLGGHGHDHDHDHEHDHNLRAAFVHVLADAVTSVAAILAIGAAWFLGWNWLDPVVAMVAAVLIMVWAVGLLRGTAKILLDTEAPPYERYAVQAALESDGDTQVTDLHVWEVGAHVWVVVASVVSHKHYSPEDYKKRLPPEINHPVIEVTYCKECGVLVNSPRRL